MLSSIVQLANSTLIVGSSQLFAMKQSQSFLRFKQSIYYYLSLCFKTYFPFLYVCIICNVYFD